MSHSTTAARNSGGSAERAAATSWSRSASASCSDGVAQTVETDLLPTPRRVEEQVRGDPVQPPLEGARLEPVQRPEDPDEDVLGEILRVVGVAGQPVGEPIHPGAVLADD